MLESEPQTFTDCPPLSQDFNSRLEHAARAPRLLIALDFDGTLAYFTQNIEDSRAVPSAAEALKKLADLESTWVAIVSGRPLGFLQQHVDPEKKMLLSGSHGGEHDFSALGKLSTSTGITLSTEQQELLEKAVATVENTLKDYPGAAAEYKPGGVAFHVRGMHEPHDQDKALTVMHERFIQYENLRITPGEMIMEASVLTTDKGQALESLMQMINPDVTLFAGDDMTDEHGLAVLRAQDIGIKVGPKDTIAPWRVSTPDAMGNILLHLAHLRTAYNPR